MRIDIAVEIVCVCVQPKDVRRNVVFHLENGAEHAISPGNNHVVFRVKLKYGAGTFCLDLTGSQFGHYDQPVMLWEKYRAERADTMNEPQAGDVMEKGYEEFGNGKPLVRDRQWRVVRTHLSLMKVFYAAYEAFKLGYIEGSTAPVSLLKLPDELFVQVREGLLLVLNQAVGDMVASLSKTGGINPSVGISKKNKGTGEGKGKRKNLNEEEDMISEFGILVMNGEHVNIEGPLTAAALDGMMRGDFIVFQ
jgi:hypothetical protein